MLQCVKTLCNIEICNYMHLPLARCVVCIALAYLYICAVQAWKLGPRNRRVRIRQFRALGHICDLKQGIFTPGPHQSMVLDSYPWRADVSTHQSLQWHMQHCSTAALQTATDKTDQDERSYDQHSHFSATAQWSNLGVIQTYILAQKFICNFVKVFMVVNCSYISIAP